MELIPNLPDEIAAECLVRVPYKSHKNLKGVCRSWRSLVKSPQFYEQRKSKGASEQCIFMLQALSGVEGGPLATDNNSKQHQNVAAAYGISVYDPVRGSWDRLPPIPEFPNSIPHFSRCVSARGKLILMGGWHPSSFHTLNCVFIYDVVCGRWTRGADMPTLRSFFACCVSELQGIVYVAGGHDEDKNALSAVEAYDVDKNEWESMAPMSKERDECEAVFMEGKLMVISGYESQSQGRFQKSGEVFDPVHARAWISLENMWGVGAQSARSCTVVALGRLYYFCKQGVMKFDGKDKVWVEVGSLPEGIRVASSATAVCGDQIFVTGCGVDKNVSCFYMFEAANGKWVEIERQGFEGYVQCATTLEL